MAADMGEFDGVNLEQFIEPFPEIDVFYLAPAVFRFATPAVLFPVFHPTGNALANVAAVGDQLDGGWAVERFRALGSRPSFPYDCWSFPARRHFARFPCPRPDAGAQIPIRQVQGFRYIHRR